jgi:hypothetical protein
MTDRVLPIIQRKGLVLRIMAPPPILLVCLRFKVVGLSLTWQKGDTFGALTERGAVGILESERASKQYST